MAEEGTEVTGLGENELQNLELPRPNISEGLNGEATTGTEEPEYAPDPYVVGCNGEDEVESLRTLTAKEVLGRKFNCPDEAHTFYNNYAKAWGFSVKIDRIVDKFEVQHSHEPARKQCTRYLRSHRGLTEADKADFRFKTNAGMRPSQVINLAVETAGGHDKLGYTKKDGYNFHSTNRTARISGGDAATALAYLESKKSADTQFILRHTVDEEN
ncbi:unnamed protein product [Linum trigynum]|uniref:Uncharacterized protein n=1 Tax=Linum trigynum TaxID=586398 RepID=A0AAV2DXZ7_9ROSI